MFFRLLRNWRKLQNDIKQDRKELNMGKNIKGLAGSAIFNQKTVDKMNGINKNNKGKHPQFIYQLKNGSNGS